MVGRKVSSLLTILLVGLRLASVKRSYLRVEQDTRRLMFIILHGRRKLEVTYAQRV